MRNGRHLENRKIAIRRDDAGWVSQVYRPSNVLDFHNFLKCLMHLIDLFCIVGPMPNFTEIGHNVAEMSHFLQLFSFW